MDPFKGSPLKEQCLFQLLCNNFIYLIGQNFVGQNFCRTRFWTPILNFDNFIRFLPDFCIKILDKILDGQNVTSDKIFDAKPKFRQFCPTKFCPIWYIQNRAHALGSSRKRRPLETGGRGYFGRREQIVFNMLRKFCELSCLGKVPLSNHFYMQMRDPIAYWTLMSFATTLSWNRL